MSRCVKWFACVIAISFLLDTVAFASGVMRIQLPFPDGDNHLCVQNSDDSPTHGRTDDNAVSVEIDPKYTLYDLDFGMNVGSILVATSDGAFTRGYDTKDGKLKGYGCYAKIDHGNGYWTMLGHTSGFIAQDGQYVVAGQPIAYSGGQVGVPCSGTSTGPHVHVGIHSGSSTGLSERMEIWAHDRNTGELKSFVTGRQGEQRDFTCWHQQPEATSAGHTYESRPVGKTFSDFSCRKLSGLNGVLCWYLNPTTCEDGQSHVRYFRNPQGAMQSESKADTWRWCLEDTGQPADVFSFLEGGYGIGGGDGGGSTLPPSDPGGGSVTPPPSSEPRNDLVPHVNAYRTTGTKPQVTADSLTGPTLPVMEGEVLTVEQIMDSKDSDASTWFREQFNSIYTTVWYKVVKSDKTTVVVDWREMFTRKFDPGKLEKGESYGESTTFTVPVGYPNHCISPPIFALPVQKRIIDLQLACNEL